MRKLRVYIAGPMYSSGHMDDNILKALRVASAIRTVNAIPIIPHLFFFWNLMDKHDREFWLKLDQDLVENVSDVLYRIEGDSEGGDYEVGWARQINIPLFSDLGCLMTYIEKWNLANGLG